MEECDGGGCGKDGDLSYGWIDGEGCGDGWGSGWGERFGDGEGWVSCGRDWAGHGDGSGEANSKGEG